MKLSFYSDQLLMKSYFPFLLVLLPIQAFGQSNVIYKSPYSIIYGNSGNPPKSGYWEYSVEHHIYKLITTESNLLIIKQSAMNILIKPKKILLSNEGPPFGEAKNFTTQLQCTVVDLSQQAGPVREQTSSGTCYAYAAMELLNFGQTKTYSALYLAEMYGKANKKSKTETASNASDQLSLVNGFNGGITADALALGLKAGLCPEENVPSIDSSNTNLENYKKLLAYYQEAKAQDLDADTVAKACEANNGGLMDSLKAIFKAITPEIFASLYSASPSASLFTEALASEACKGKVEKNLPPGKTNQNIKNTRTDYFENGRLVGIFDEKRKELIDHLNNTLTHKKPVVLSLLAGGLIKTKNPINSDTGDNIQHDSHASVVLGRKWVDEVKDGQGNIIQEGGCFYLAKNSWGEDWKVPEGLGAKSVEGKPGYFMMSQKKVLEYSTGALSLE